MSSPNIRTHSSHTHTHTFFALLTSCLPDFLSPCCLKAEPNQLVYRNCGAINNEDQSAAAEETGGGEAPALLSASAAQDAGASKTSDHITIRTFHVLHSVFTLCLY